MILPRFFGMLRFLQDDQKSLAAVCTSKSFEDEIDMENGWKITLPYWKWMVYRDGYHGKSIYKWTNVGKCWFSHEKWIHKWWFTHDSMKKWWFTHFGKCLPIQSIHEKMNDITLPKLDGINHFKMGVTPKWMVYKWTCQWKWMVYRDGYHGKSIYKWTNVGECGFLTMP